MSNQKIKIAATTSLLVAGAALGLVMLPIAGLTFVVLAQLKNRK
jgi:hypothetical protein